MGTNNASIPAVRSGTAARPGRAVPRELQHIEEELQRLVEGLVFQLTELARSAALETLESTLGARGPRRDTARPRAPARKQGRAGQRGGPRDTFQHELLEFIFANPGLRIEQIYKQLGLAKKDVAVPIRKLITAGAVRAKGRDRSITYFPARVRI